MISRRRGIAFRTWWLRFGGEVVVAAAAARFVDDGV